MELVQSPVVFDREAHTYTYQGRQLSGITSMLSRQLFASKYDGVSPAVLARAAERGRLVHSQCELADRLGITESPEAEAYASLCRTEGLRHVESEYLVSDQSHFASCIDKVFRGMMENDYWLADIKTTYALDKEYLRWQLSAYAYLFELQNHGKRVTRLLGIWIRDGMARLCEVQRIEASTVRALLLADTEGRQFASSLPVAPDGQPLPAEYRAVESTVVAMQAEYERLGERLKELKARLLADMEAKGVTKFTGERLAITRKAATETATFDAKAFQYDHPNLYKQYCRTSRRSGSVTLKII